METIVLAGGLGTRLQSVVKNMPKPRYKWQTLFRIRAEFFTSARR